MRHGPGACDLCGLEDVKNLTLCPCMQCNSFICDECLDQVDSCLQDFQLNKIELAIDQAWEMNRKI